MTTDNRVVLFADVLGFAALTEGYPIDLHLLKASDRVLSPLTNIDTILETNRNRLVHTFSGFHRSLRAVLDLASMSHPLTAVAFSDSAFVAATHAYEALNIAIDLIHSLLSQSIPARIGVGYGSFAALRFSSDITSDSGDHVAQFLGTAVVRAYAAEACGIKGLRILLHPSVMPLLDDASHNPLPPTRQRHPLHHLACSEQESMNKAGVQHEIDYWHLAPTKEAQAWRELQDMWSNAPMSEVKHYEATAEAIDRMRIAQGHEPLNSLRRRTLPHKS